MTQQNSYREYLKTVFEERSAKNPRYSLRAMAKQIGVSPATLSGVLNKKKNLSIEKANSVSKALKLSSKNVEIFLLLVQIETTKNEDLKNVLTSKLRSIGGCSEATNLSIEHFKIISEWYHYALLSLTELKKFKLTPTTVFKAAKLLGITKIEVTNAISRLEKLEMIELKNGIYTSTNENVCVAALSPNLALRKYHKQMLDKAMASVETQNLKEKYIGSETLAIDSSKIGVLAELTEEYFNKVINLANSSKEKDHVYHLGVQFFRLTEKDI